MHYHLKEGKKGGRKGKGGGDSGGGPSGRPTGKQMISAKYVRILSSASIVSSLISSVSNKEVLWKSIDHKE